MRKGIRTALTIATAPLLTLSQTADAVVIVNDAVLYRESATRQTLYLSQSIPIGEGLFAIWIDTFGSPAFFQFSYAGIAEEFGLFAVTLGTAFDPTYVLANDPIVSNNGVDPGSSQQQFALNQSKYFGYWDDRVNGNTPDSNDNYGWVKITRTASGLEASSGATAIGGGIVVGTTNQIPEPSSSLLITLALGLTLRRRTRRKC